MDADFIIIQLIFNGYKDVQDRGHGFAKVSGLPLLCNTHVLQSERIYATMRTMKPNMEIPFNKLLYSFRKKPLLVGGKAMEYYGLRKSGADIDFIADKEDVYHLIQQYPERVKDLWGDLGVCPFEFEIWKTICLLSYADLCENALDEGDFLVISLEKLLVLKALAMNIEKYRIDTQLIVQELLKRQYQAYDQVKAENMDFVSQIQGIIYIETSGPGK